MMNSALFIIFYLKPNWIFILLMFYFKENEGVKNEGVKFDSNKWNHDTLQK